MKTLLIVDVQNDFMPNGALPVPKGDTIVPIINQLQPQFDLVVATQDWHPANHKSFASNHDGKKPFEKIQLQGLEQVLWPDHCVQGTNGADFHPQLDTQSVAAIFRKGMDVNIDSYSGFFDNGRQNSTGLAGYLRAKGITELYCCGLAADICVYFTILDAVKAGFKVHLLMEASQPLVEATFLEQLDVLRSNRVNLC
ncbi:MAG: bifunctional nicotinamidase/pyrazinamidase [Bacteroidota bacterium]